MRFYESMTSRLAVTRVTPSILGRAGMQTTGRRRPAYRAFSLSFSYRPPPRACLGQVMLAFNSPTSSVYMKQPTEPNTMCMKGQGKK